MKIILSRKGFDSGNGGQASPILPDGTLLSLPIPAKKDKLAYKDIFFRGKSYDDIIFELSGLGISYRYAHLDPDIRYDAKKRQEDKKSWLAAFGQHGAAQTLLENCGIGEGDIFLFFGWFREAEVTKAGTYQYKKPAKDFHVIWGYMKVGSTLKTKVGCDSFAKTHCDISEHPHAHYFAANPGDKNCIYVAAKTLLPESKLNGAGLLKNKSAQYPVILTEAGKPKSNWLLPKTVFAGVKFCSPAASFDGDGRFSWKTFGQEFVIDCDKYSNVKNWAIKLIESNYDDSKDS
ncbi:MAG: hypothetical protein Pg6C_11200 [Treponemataceae bacterium]|nr:MAG: hypothetical protein Pg6C_11200 [Treponemataceae bacterium]